MSIIYSYPTIQPTVDDLLIGTDTSDDNATKSFTVQSLVSLINAAAGSGTVTSVQIATDSFLSASGGPITDAGTITMGLAATGTPDATTFLRGDNQWVVPTVASGIGIFSSGTVVTTDLASANFTGAGVQVTSDVSGNISVSIPGAANAVESIIQGNGISINSSTGDITITNAGITGLVQGNGISISTTAAGVSTIGVTGQTSGTVVSVAAGDGLEITNNDTTVSPIIALDYDGADTYITNPSTGDPQSTDNFAFQKGTSGVRQGTFSTLPVDSLAAVKTYIDNQDSKSVQHDTDTYSSVPTATKVITLTQQEWDDLSPTATPPGAGYDAGTIYLTTATSSPQNTVNFTIDTSAITYTGSCGFTEATTVNGTSVSPIAITGAVGSSYTVETTITPTGTNCTLSGGSAAQTLTGTIPSTPTPATVTQTLAARTISAPAPPGNVNDTLTISANISGSASGYTITSNSPLNGPQGTSFNTSAFGLTATSNANYAFTSGPSVSYNQSTSTYGSNTTTGTVTGTSAPVNYDLEYTVTPSGGLSSGYGTTWKLQTTGDFVDTNAPLSSAAAISKPYNSTYLFNAEAVGINNNTVTGSYWGGPTSGTITGNTNIAGSLTGTVQANQGTASATIGTNSISGNASWYTLSYTWRNLSNTDAPLPYTLGQSVTGNTGDYIQFIAAATPASSLYNFNGYQYAQQVGTVTLLVGTPTNTGTMDISGTAAVNRFSIQIAGIGGSPGAGACAYGATVTAYVTNDPTGGITTGVAVYNANTGNQVYAGSGSYRTFITPNNTPGWVTFNSSGVVTATGAC